MIGKITVKSSGHDCASESQGSPPQTLSNELVWIDYTNHRGERRWRHIDPEQLVFHATEWHERPQWLLEATDGESGNRRSFAMQDIHAWRATPPEDADA